jgi:hypothetical protein
MNKKRKILDGEIMKNNKESNWFVFLILLSATSCNSSEQKSFIKNCEEGNEILKVTLEQHKSLFSGVPGTESYTDMIGAAGGLGIQDCKYLVEKYGDECTKQVSKLDSNIRETFFANCIAMASAKETTGKLMKNIEDMRKNKN